MRTEIVLQNAYFTKNEEQGWEKVTLPHTWNVLDGQDGGADYDRGAYRYRIILPQHTPGKRQYIQFDGANHIASVWCSGEYLGKHEGGFSTFRFELTDTLGDGENELLVEVDNRRSHVYPQQADFTFFGGLYRPVRFLETECGHFELMKDGTDGIFVTSEIDGQVRIDAFVSAVQEGGEVQASILDMENRQVLKLQAPAREHTALKGRVPAPHLWNGICDPYCYTAELTLIREGKVLDCVKTRFGFRSFSVNSEKGFMLNGREYSLRGVSRHQDRENMGWAIGEKEHREDLELIKEIGANTIRLAHYQHSQYFTGLCDQAGMVLWMEIPFITIFMNTPEARENTLLQMRELITQNYNHPSVCFWGISNEISIGGISQALEENLRELNHLAHELDPGRLTVMAQVSTLDMDSPLNRITDVLGYNQYFGWYSGKTEDNKKWLDSFHKKYPERALGLSEYGAETVLSWHTETPKAQDYTEEYQALYHEDMLKIFAQRPWLWSTYVWNMFDFAADARSEGGSSGRNNKGLVTYDRRIKKDAFFVYKAFWSREPFVHICGRRFADRGPGQRDIKIYSNAQSVTLLINGREYRTQKGNRIFVFRDVPLEEGDNTLMAKADNLSEDVIHLNGTQEPNTSYIFSQNEEEGVTNWFEGLEETAAMEFPEGFFSVRDKVGEVAANPEAAAVLQFIFDRINEKEGTEAAGYGASMDSLMDVLRDVSVEQFLKMAGKHAPAGLTFTANTMLIKIKK